MEKHKNISSICIVGRPNVGKSSLFNLLMGERRAVVVGQSGTTRDRIETLIRISGLNVKLVDTGGYLSKNIDILHGDVKDQIYQAMEESSIVLMLVDTIAGVSPMDEEVAHLLRKFSKPVVLVANKADSDKLSNEAIEFYKLGFGHPESISCVHRRGIRKLKKRVKEEIEKLVEREEISSDEDQASENMKIAVVGRPNVGKSSFVNNLLKSNRVIVSDIPGTTRDSIDTYFSYEDAKYTLIDTAGIRHRRKVKTPVDFYSMMRSKEAITRADVVLLLLDAAEGITRDDLGILDTIEK